MTQKTELKGFSIVQHFEKEELKPITIRQLSQKTGRSYASTYEDVQTLADSGIITIEKLGSATLCSINLNNEKSIALLTAASLLRSAESLQDEERSRVSSALKHISEHALTAWVKDSTIHCITQSSIKVHNAEGIPINHIEHDKLDELRKGLCIHGAEKFWRMMAQKQ